MSRAARLKCLLGAALVCLAAGLAQAQVQVDDDIELDFKKPDAAEAQRLQQLLDDPLPQGLSRSDLRQYFWDKERAARTLGGAPRFEQVMRQAVAAFPDATFKRKLAQGLHKSGQYTESNALMQQAIAEGAPVESGFSSATLVCNLFHQHRDAEARATAQQADAKISTLLRRMTDMEKRVKLWRAAARRDSCLSLLEDRLGHTRQATEFARTAEQYARLALAQIDSQSNSSARMGVLLDVGTSIARRLDANLGADQLNDAEIALGEYLRFSRSYQLPAGKLSELYQLAGSLRLAQREFVQAERYLRKADAVLAGLDLEPLNRLRLKAARELLRALIGQHRWTVALAELDRLDQVAGTAAPARAAVRFALLRGIVYLEAGRAPEAAVQLEAAAQQLRAQYGGTHFYAAQASGLHGAALWRSGSTQSQVLALPLLKAAVRDLMAPANADFLESTGIRREVRDIVFGAYLEAAAASSVPDAIEAMGPADWARGSVIKDALNDAAVRSSVTTPALADVVRREQDAKNEIAGLRRFLAGEIGAEETPLPQVAAQMRERIAALEAERTTLQAELRAKFPNYDALLRPPVPRAQDIVQKLGADQALVLLLPSRDAVYVWALAAGKAPAFVRAQVSASQLKQWVGSLRRQLDFGAEASAGTQFDGAAAFALYDRLLAPLQTVLEGKSQLIVAAGGVLGQLPFGLLHTSAGGGFDATAPWLIRRTAVSQVPSLSAWLAFKSLAQARSATQAFAGWGDPVFDLQANALAVAPQTGTRRLALTRAAVLADADAPDSAAPSVLQYARIPTLPDTREELQSIAAALRADAGQDLLLGTQATRSSVLQASASGLLLNKRVLAFATHGLMAGDLPKLTQPALALAATGAEDKDPLAALLTLEDVLTLKLNADWVVLSACNSAAEDGRGDEAMSGLARGFFYAGSRSLLVTHWAVESESAKLLTTETFKHYAANPTAPKAESLRQAMLKLMDMPQYRHPAYWAPYALVGDGGR